MWKNKTNQLGSTNIICIKNKIKESICFRVKLRGYWTLLIQLIYWLTDSKVVEPRMSTVLVSRGLCLCQGRIDHVMENNGNLKNPLYTLHKGPKGHNICRILPPNRKSCKNEMVYEVINQVIANTIVSIKFFLNHQFRFFISMTTFRSESCYISCFMTIRCC